MPPWQMALSLSLSLLSVSICINIYIYIYLCSLDSLLVVLLLRHGSPVSLRLSLAAPSFLPSFSLPFCFYRPYGCAGVHRCQLSRIIIHSERMWFPFQITKYGASAQCAPHTSFGWSLFSFLPRFRPGSTSTILFNTPLHPETRV